MADAKTKAGNKGAGGDDQSMEEILQSIRKIIAEENDDPAETGETGEAANAAADSDVLELTDAIQEDGSVVNVNDDVLDDIDDALKNTAPEPEPEADAEPEPEPAPEPAAEPEAEAEPEPAPAPAPAPKPAEKAPKPAADKVAEPSEGLVSAVSIAASAEAMRALKGNHNLGALPFVSGETVEGLVMQLLRPMLKEWLDANLPGIVQKEVQREVQRITASLEQEE